MKDLPVRFSASSVTHLRSDQPGPSGVREFTFLFLIGGGTYLNSVSTDYFPVHVHVYNSTEIV